MIGKHFFKYGEDALAHCTQHWESETYIAPKVSAEGLGMQAIAVDTVDMELKSSGDVWRDASAVLWVIQRMGSWLELPR